MLEFRTANVAATANAPSAAYKAIPERSTSAISNGLDRLFGTTPSSRTHSRSRESSVSSVPENRQEWEVSAAAKRHKARGYDDVNRELDDYLEEELEAFSRTEEVNGIERRVVFDLLAYWQVRASIFISCRQF